MPLSPSPELQTIWICEFSPRPGQGGVGGFDWFRQCREDNLAGPSSDALDRFTQWFHQLRTPNGSQTHDCAIYTVGVPTTWTAEQIQAWCEDHTNVIPECPPV